MKYAKKKQAAEYPFENIKYNMKYTEFLTREISKNKVEQNLLNISHNLKGYGAK